MQEDQGLGDKQNVKSVILKHTLLVSFPEF